MQPITISEKKKVNYINLNPTKTDIMHSSRLALVHLFFHDKMSNDYLAIKVIKSHRRIIRKLTSKAEAQSKAY